jgi:hypothetical protein
VLTNNPDKAIVDAACTFGFSGGAAVAVSAAAGKAACKERKDWRLSVHRQGRTGADRGGQGRTGADRGGIRL